MSCLCMVSGLTLCLNFEMRVRWRSVGYQFICVWSPRRPWRFSLGVGSHIGFLNIKGLEGKKI